MISEIREDAVLRLEGVRVALAPPHRRRRRRESDRALKEIVHGVDLEIRAGETVGVVGESGSGKSVTMLTIMGLLDDSLMLTAGRVEFKGRTISELSETELQRIRGREVAMVYQDPMTSLNPLMRVGDQVCEAMSVHGVGRAEAEARTLELFRRVGIPDPARTVRSFPHEFSGGMRQRVVIAMALALGPSLLIAESTLAKALVRTEELTSGTVVLDGVDLTALHGRRLRRQRRNIQLVFQDPYSSLNPRKEVGATLSEVLKVHGLGGGSSGRQRRVRELLNLVGLAPGLASRRPSELSGGQRQRVGIARALAVEPRVLILDEPVSALDVSVRAEVMNLLVRLQEELGLAYIFISHDVSMVRQISSRVAVMYLGRVVEVGGWKDVLDSPLHPYTEGLRASVPVPDPGLRQPPSAPIQGELPNPARPPRACRFHPRCPMAIDVCREVAPPLAELRPAHEVACHVAAMATRTV